MAIIYLTHLTQFIRLMLKSAEGAAFSSRGRKAVDQNLEMKSRPGRAGTLGALKFISAAPAALNHYCFAYPRPHGRGYLMPVLRTLAPTSARLFNPVSQI